VLNKTSVFLYSHLQWSA